MFILLLLIELKFEKKLVSSLFLYPPSSTTWRRATDVLNRTDHRACLSDTKEEDILLTIIRKHGSLLDITLVQSWYEAFCQQHTFDSSPRLRDTQPSSQIKLLASRFSTSKELLRSVFSFLLLPVLLLTPIPSSSHTRAILKKRDREQVLEIIMEPNTPILIRSTLTVFYESIYKIADSTKLADRLGDYQLFIDDLLKVCSSDSKGE